MTQNNGNMNQENQEEVVLSFGKTTLPYTVPQGYFETLADDVISAIHVDAYPKTASFTVPEGYFDGFAESVLQKIRHTATEDEDSLVHELKDIAPLLTTISRRNVYTVPEGYFEHFTINTPETKIVALKNPRVTSKKSIWKGLVAAACLLIVVLTIAFFTNRDNENVTAVNPIENKTQNYAAAANTGIDSTNPNIQNTKKYLNTPYAPSENGGVKYIEPQKLNVINVSQEINFISSSDLEDYLNSTPAIN